MAKFSLAAGVGGAMGVEAGTTGGGGGAGVGGRGGGVGAGAGTAMVCEEGAATWTMVAPAAGTGVNVVGRGNRLPHLGQVMVESILTIFSFIFMRAPQSEQ